eukprot:1093840-Alexandrium_andersonii.AAC.1
MLRKGGQRLCLCSPLATRNQQRCVCVQGPTGRGSLRRKRRKRPREALEEDVLREVLHRFLLRVAMPILPTQFWQC